MAVGNASDGLADALSVFRECDPGEPLATSEVADKLECTRRTTYNRLDELVDRGVLRTKKVGAKGRVWWLSRDSGDGTGEDAPATAGDGQAGLDVVGPHYRRLVESAPVPIGVFTPTEGIVYANEATAEFVGVDDPEELLGRSPFEFIAESERDTARERVSGAVEDGTAAPPIRGQFRTVDGEERVAVVTTTPVTHEGRDAAQFVLKDVTERLERERELEAANERLNAVIDSSPAAIMSLDLEDRVRQWNPAAERIFGWSEEEVLGGPLPTVPEDRTGSFESINSRLRAGEHLDGVEIRRQRKDGTLIDVSLSAAPLRNADGEVVGVTAALADITDRKESERRLQREKERFETLVSNLPGMVYRCRTGHGWPMEFVSEGCADLTGYDPETVESDEVLWEELIHPDDRAAVREAVEAGVEDGTPFQMTYRIRRADGTERWVWEQGRCVEESEDEVVLEGYVTDVTERKRQQRRLQRQREQLATLNDLNEVVQRTTHAIVEADDRADLERSLCTELADSDQYFGAWIGDWRGADAEAFRVRASEGCSDGAQLAGGPAGEALRTGEPLVRRGTEEVGCTPPETSGAVPTTAASFPIVHDGITYGVLTVCSGRPEAFDARELSIVARLAEVVGHAIAAVDRKEALMGGRATVLEFRSGALLPEFPPEVDAEDVDVSVDRTIPLGDGTVFYCTVSGMDPDVFGAATEDLPQVESVSRVDGIVGDPQFEVRFGGETVGSVLAAKGGRVRSVEILDDEVRITAEVTTGSDVRRVVEAVRGTFPDLKLVSRGTVERAPHEAPDAAVYEALTDRQQRVLEAAFQAGYFDRPRRSTGEEVAETLDVSASTFHEHLRIGERKLFEALFDD